MRPAEPAPGAAGPGLPSGRAGPRGGAHQVVRYLLAGGVAALANYGSRFVFNAWMPFEPAVVLAYLVGMGTGFVLMRRFAFGSGTQRVGTQALWYAAVNLFAIAQTVAVSSALLRIVLPALGVHEHAEALAHAAGVATPLVSSYFGHKRLTFR